MKIFRNFKRAVKRLTFPGSGTYWEKRYQTGGNSGPGSSGDQAAFKARVLNTFVKQNGIRSVVEFGCGDGMQLALAEYPRYMGLDVSPTAINLCRKRFAADTSKVFVQYEAGGFRSSDFGGYDLGLSLDVIFHLVEDDVFETYLADLFSVSRRYVIIYSTDFDDSSISAHVKHRQFTPLVREKYPLWTLQGQIKNELVPARSEGVYNTSDFYIYARNMSIDG